MKKAIKCALALSLCCATAVGLFGCAKPATEESTTTPPAAVTQDGTVAASTAPSDTTAATENTDPTETTTKKAKEENGGGYTVNQALDALSNYYGKGYDVNGTVSEGNTYYFAVYKIKTKYASVKVNMQNGDAVETRTKDGATANFNLFV